MSWEPPSVDSPRWLRLAARDHAPRFEVDALNRDATIPGGKRGLRGSAPAGKTDELSCSGAED